MAYGENRRQPRMKKRERESKRESGKDERERE